MPAPATPLSHLSAITLATAPDPAADPLRPLAERQIALLGELAELDLDVARVLAGRVKAAGPEADVEALAGVYARVARAVRLTVMLQSKLIEELKRQDSRRRSEAKVAGRMAAYAAAQAAEAFQAQEDDAKIRARSIIRRVIRAENDDIDRFERLDTEACERLDDQDLYGAVSTRPMSAVVAGICRDLGLSPDWTRLADEAWAVEEIASGEAGWPLSPTSPTRSVAGGVSPVAAKDLAAMRTPADAGAKPGEERVLEGESHAQHANAILVSNTS